MYKYFTWTGISTILETIYVDEDTYTQLHVSSSNKAYIVTSSELKGVLISLEETNQKDFFNIEFKVELIPPTPCPYPKWIEVGTREKNKWDNWQITYDFIENKRYRVYYSWNIYNPVYAIQEFIITDDRIAGVEIEVFNNNSNVLVLSVNHAKFITIYSLKGSYKGNTWKLEELQE